MSSRELERVEVMGRVRSGDLKVGDAAVMLKLSYRQVKRLWTFLKSFDIFSHFSLTPAPSGITIRLFAFTKKSLVSEVRYVSPATPF